MKKENTNTKVFKLARERLAPHNLFILGVILPQGSVRGAYYIASNVIKADGSLTSIQFDLKAGKWLDLESVNDAQGSDIISLHVYLNGTRQKESLIKLVLLVGQRPASVRARALESNDPTHISSILPLSMEKLRQLMQPTETDELSGDK